MVTVVLPVFAIILAGFGARKVGVLGPHASLDLNRYVSYLALPALLFDVMAGADWGNLDLMEFVAIFALSSTVIYGVTVVLCLFARNNLSDASVDGLGAAYSNTGYMGIPLCLLVLGTDSLPAVTLAAVATTVVLFAIAIVLVEAGRQTQPRGVAIVLTVGGSLIRNPLIIAPLLGGIWAAAGLPMPMALDSFLDLLGASAAPCALVSLGLFFADSSKESTGRIWSKAALLSTGKLLVHPALTWVLAMFFGLPPFLAGIAVLLSALPTGTGPFMLAELYGRETVTTSSAVMLSTLVSLVTITFLLYWGGYAELEIATR
ncbi:AEC family transporter [Methyloceanibacter stevinii]